MALDGHGTADTELGTASPPMTVLNALFSDAVPTKAFLEQFGISGRTAVATRRGLIPTESLTSDDELITRSGAMVHPVGVIRSAEHPTSPYAPVSVRLADAFFNEEIPQQDIIIGRQTQLQVFMHQGDEPLPNLVSFDLGICGRAFSVSKLRKPRLFVPVFAEQTYVLMQGLYILCPSLEELSQASGATIH